MRDVIDVSTCWRISEVTTQDRMDSGSGRSTLAPMNTNKREVEQSRSRLAGIIFGIVLGLAAVVTLIWSGGLVWLVLHMLNII